MLLQTFQFTKADASYRLKIQTALTIKPKGFFMKAKLRDPNFTEYAGLVGGAAETEKKKDQGSQKSKIDPSKLVPMKILYGSNTGTCEALAQGLAASAPEHGFNASIASLDDAVSSLVKKVPVVIFTASYEGQPPDNAGHFVEWLKSGGGEEFADVPFAVFGVGNSTLRIDTSNMKSQLTLDSQRNGFTLTRRSPRLWTKHWRRMVLIVWSTERKPMLQATRCLINPTTGKRTNFGLR